ncbi:MAG: dihydrofolate reductase [Cryobacterium sp.]|nr:dihydrofolate reductase [Oligoflexia bacterium]
MTTEQAQASLPVRINLIAAVSLNGVIGLGGSMPWDLPEDLKRFREVTYGAPVVMGRKTYESIGRLLPGRKNVIISRDQTRLVPGAWMAPTLNRAIQLASENASDVFVIGGGEIYRMALPFSDRLYITEIDLDTDGDAFFPEWPAIKDGAIAVDGKSIQFIQSKCEERPADLSAGRPSFRYLVFDRVATPLEV